MAQGKSERAPTVEPLERFMLAHRDEILSRIRAEVGDHGPRDARIEAWLCDLFDTQVRALSSESEGQRLDLDLVRGSGQGLAEAGRRAGLSIAEVASALGAISRALGELAEREHIAFEAKQYKLFDITFDRAMETAMQRYADESAASEQEDHAKRVGFLLHELRNAVGTAHSAIDLLERGNFRLESPAGRVLKRSIAGLRRLVSESLLAARLEGGAEVKTQPVDVDSLVADLAAEVPTERGITIAVSADPGLRVETDEMLLASAAGNILANAVKFTRSGGRVELRARRSPDGAVVIEVEDECGGLPPGSADRLFEPFVQGGRARRGVGLGLSITREAVAAIGGEMSVRDMPGKGCVFAIRLPK